MVNKYLYEVPWEKRALGISSFQVDFNKAIDMGFLKEEINQNSQLYGKIFIQAFVSFDDYKIIPDLNAFGFYYVETRVTPYFLLEKDRISKLLCSVSPKLLSNKLICDDIEFFEADKSDSNIQTAIKKIAVEAFTKDRFHLDPMCRNDLANLRFVNWLDDIISDVETSIYVVSIKGKVGGFLAIKNDRMLLIAIGNKYRNNGLGRFLWSSVIRELFVKGIKIVETTVSTSNTESLNLHASLGFKFKRPIFIFHYWSNP